jgi:hypothetical protein
MLDVEAQPRDAISDALAADCSAPTYGRSPRDSLSIITVTHGSPELFRRVDAWRLERAIRTTATSVLHLTPRTRLYYPGMIRSFAVLAASVATVLGGVALATTAAATPSDGATDPSCVYTLSTPQVVQVSGVPMVTATLKPYPCTGSINPNYLNVCLKAETNAGAGTCGFSAVPSMAEVFLPYKPGTTYVASGTGCGSVYTTQGSLCSSLGPFSTTL